MRLTTVDSRPTHNPKNKLLGAKHFRNAFQLFLVRFAYGKAAYTLRSFKSIMEFRNKTMLIIHFAGVKIPRLIKSFRKRHGNESFV